MKLEGLKYGTGPAYGAKGRTGLLAEATAG